MSIRSLPLIEAAEIARQLEIEIWDTVRRLDSFNSGQLAQIATKRDQFDKETRYAAIALLQRDYADCKDIRDWYESQYGIPRSAWWVLIR